MGARSPESGRFMRPVASIALIDGTRFWADQAMFRHGPVGVRGARSAPCKRVIPVACDQWLIRSGTVHRFGREGGNPSASKDFMGAPGEPALQMWGAHQGTQEGPKSSLKGTRKNH